MRWHMGAEAPARDNMGTALGTVSHGPLWQSHKPSALLGGEERPETSPPFPRGGDESQRSGVAASVERHTCLYTRLPYSCFFYF